MSLEIKRIVNSPIDSNCFIIYSKNKKCIVIDPGSQNAEEIIKFLDENELYPEYIILTHEHFDHVWSVNDLKLKYNSKIITSHLCGIKILNAKKNMSIFYNQIGFECVECDITTESIQNKLIWENENILFINTPGHTDCGISILINNNIFVGDLMIPEHKTVTKLPSGNKLEVKKTIENLYSNYKDKDLKVYPGHGDIFKLNRTRIDNFV